MLVVRTGAGGEAEATEGRFIDEEQREPIPIVHPANDPRRRAGRLLRDLIRRAEDHENLAPISTPARHTLVLYLSIRGRQPAEVLVELLVLGGLRIGIAGLAELPPEMGPIGRSGPPQRVQGGIRTEVAQQAEHLIVARNQ